MTVDELAASTRTDAAPPPDLSLAAKALWFAKAGDWEKAHDLCQDLPGEDGSWIHAWLHREEGDLGNAAYWYAKAGKPLPSNPSLADEWREIASAVLRQIYR